ncbi:MAG: LysR family transcriptional regulator [Alphaproteobacteria bacterium]|nr:MAG: LysR family transcriptional regulator [Alphaproteobacteria bacterium]
MKLEFLVTLDAILKTGSFAAAAKEVGLTASAVSLQVKRLEEHLGRPLFDRSGRIAKPTALARELSQNVRAALEAVEAARSRSTVTVSGRVVLGSIRTMQTTIIPTVLREISSRHPDLSVKVIQGDSVELLSQLKAGELDGAAIIRPSSGGSSRLEWTDLEQQPFVFVAPVESGNDTIEQLIERYDWLQFDTSLTGGRVASSYIHRLSPQTRAKFEMESIEAILAMVSAGLGVSIVPKVAGPAIPGYPVRQISLGANGPSRKIAFVCRGTDVDNRRVIALRSAFQASYEMLARS